MGLVEHQQLLVTGAFVSAYTASPEDGRSWRRGRRYMSSSAPGDFGCCAVVRAAQRPCVRDQRSQSLPTLSGKIREISGRSQGGSGSLCYKRKIQEKGYLMSSQGYLMSSQGYLMSSQGYLMSSQGYLMSSQGYLMSIPPTSPAECRRTGSHCAARPPRRRLPGGVCQEPDGRRVDSSSYLPCRETGPHPRPAKMLLGPLGGSVPPARSVRSGRICDGAAGRRRGVPVRESAA